MTDQVTFLRLSTIFKYLNATVDSRCVTEGEQILSAKLLLLCGVSKTEGSKLTIAGLCLQTSSLQSAPHEIEGQLEVNGSIVTIENFKCTCKAGLSGTCKHVSACLLYCNRLYKKKSLMTLSGLCNFYLKILYIFIVLFFLLVCCYCFRRSIDSLEKVSSTDLACYWKLSKKEVTQQFAPTAVSNYACIRKVRKRCRDLTEEENRYCLAEFRNLQQSSILSKHFGRIGGSSKKIQVNSSPSKSGVKVLQNPDITKVLEHSTKSQFLPMLKIDIPELQTCCLNIINTLKATDYEVAARVVQRSDDWKKFREFRITGSSCYSVFTFSKPDWAEKTQSIFFPRQFQTEATKHGITFEEEALMKYQEVTEYKVITDIGIIIPQLFPWLGYSPDGVVMDCEGHIIKLVEVKCPLAGVEENAESMVKKCEFLSWKNNSFHLKERHRYNGQIQLGLALLNLDICDLIIYSSKSKTFVKIEVHFDNIFARDLITKVSYNYFHKMIHYACNK